MLSNFCLFHPCQPLTPVYRDLRAGTHRLLGNFPHAKSQMPISLAFSLCGKHLDLGKFYLALPAGGIKVASDTVVCRGSADIRCHQVSAFRHILKAKSFPWSTGPKQPGFANILRPCFLLFFHLLTRCQPHPPVPHLNMLRTVPFQDLCTHCSLCLGHPSPRYPHGSLSHFLQVSAPQRSFPWPSFLHHTPSLSTPLPWLIVFLAGINSRIHLIWLIQEQHLAHSRCLVRGCRRNIGSWSVLFLSCSQARTGHDQVSPWGWQGGGSKGRK